MEIVKRHDNQGSHEFWFDNGAWVSVDLEGEGYEFQSDPDDEETYLEGCLELDEGKTALEGYDGCYELPREVVVACSDLGLKISECI